jgi:hypothetical protein
MEEVMKTDPKLLKKIKKDIKSEKKKTKKPKG